MDSDLILAGGGLANGLIAYRLRQIRPELRIVILERAPQLGGNHTWSFHKGDISDTQHDWLSPFVEHSWDQQSVRFPAHSRDIAQGYRSMTSERFHQILSQTPGLDIRLNTDIVDMTPTSVTLGTGETLSAPAVIDGRGLERNTRLVIGHQKFLGHEVTLKRPHALAGPIIMDATVPQKDGYRFLYTLPFTDTRILIEDTRYSDGAALDVAGMRPEIHLYAETQGWEIDTLVREETGVLPVALAGDIEGFWADAPQGLPRSGLRGAFFHPTTGYSVPDAVRIADAIATQRDIKSDPLYDFLRTRSIDQWRSQWFFRLLNRFWFIACVPQRRYFVMQRFYALNENLIERFYAGRLKTTDCVRILTGKPPVPIHRAMTCLSEKSAYRHQIGETQ